MATVTCDAADAEAFLDGVSTGALPRSIRLPVEPGKHDLVVRGKTLGSRSLAFTARAGQAVAGGAGSGGAERHRDACPLPRTGC